MRFEWDEIKNVRNQRKHEGISFEIATSVFMDFNCVVLPDRIDESGEQRWHAIGSVSLNSTDPAVIVVVHVYREDYYGEEIIRIISARSAEKHERRRYPEQTLD